MFAFVIVHFGDQPKYLELEIYLCMMLKKNTKYDIIYLYSKNDTPNTFINIIKKYCNKTISFDDNYITYNIDNFKSYYTRFNTLRTCNFLFAYKLTEYKKICLIESDTIIIQNIDDIFKLKTPAVHFYNNTSNIFSNYKKIINSKDELYNCNNNSSINGGVMLFKPSIKKYNKAIQNIKYVIKNNCKYPNETLFLTLYDKYYNLPFKYNGMIYNLDIYKNGLFVNEIYKQKFKQNILDYMSIIHINAKEYKHVDIIRDNWLENYKTKKPNLYYFLKIFKNLYYTPKVEKLVSKL
jgi:alpha-N-acetylglucosamine transferase